MCHRHDVVKVIPRKDSNEVIVEKLVESSVFLKLQNAHDAADEITETAFVIGIRECESDKRGLRWWPIPR
jgi:hypothetical protein